MTPVVQDHPLQLPPRLLIVTLAVMTHGVQDRRRLHRRQAVTQAARTPAAQRPRELLGLRRRRRRTATSARRIHAARGLRPLQLLRDRRRPLHRDATPAAQIQGGHTQTDVIIILDRRPTSMLDLT